MLQPPVLPKMWVVAVPMQNGDHLTTFLANQLDPNNTVPGTLERVHLLFQRLQLLRGDSLYSNGFEPQGAYLFCSPQTK